MWRAEFVNIDKGISMKCFPPYRSTSETASGGNSQKFIKKTTITSRHIGSRRLLGKASPTFHRSR